VLRRYVTSSWFDQLLSYFRKKIAAQSSVGDRNSPSTDTDIPATRCTELDMRTNATGKSSKKVKMFPRGALP